MIYEVRDVVLDYSKIDATKTDYIPKLKIFIPNTEGEVSRYTQNRPTVLILPGGGYTFTSYREAEPIAFRFLARGINAAVLHYSVKPALFPVALLETLSAIKFLREKAKEYNGDKNKIYVCGFSAGGHLAASAATLWNKKESRSYFNNTESVKPDGAILAYPVIVNDYDVEKRIHKASFDSLLGNDKNNKEMLEYLCLDKQVSEKTPPTFLWSTFEDNAVPCESTLRFASALRKCGVPFELHIYEKGVHGSATGDFITNENELRAKNWLNEACNWILDTRAKYID